MSYAPLHAYSEYSILKSGLKLESFLALAKKRNIKYIGITDINLMSGFPVLEKLSKKYSIKPIYGLEIIFRNFTFSFLIKNESGYRNLLKIKFLNSVGKLDLDKLKELSKGLITIVPINNEKMFSTFCESIDKFSRFLLKLSKGFETFYLGLEENHLDLDYLNKVRDFAESHCYDAVAFPSIIYLNSDDAITLEIVNAINKSLKLDYKEKSGDHYFKTYDELKTVFTEKELQTTIDIAEKIDFTFKQKRGKIIPFKNLLNLESNEYLKKVAIDGLKKKNKYDQEHLERLEKELDVIQQMGYSDYFLIVQDFLNFAKNSDMIVGPGRGSAPGSLVAFALDITQPDPLEFNLLFERFLNLERAAMPDIDSDFPDIKREEVVEYLRNKYGRDHVCNVITFQTFGAKQALNDIQKVFKYEEHEIKMISNLLDADLTLRENYKLKPELRKLLLSDEYYMNIVKLASKIEGLPRQPGLHPAGIIINAEPIYETMPVIVDSNGMMVGEFEKDYIEDQNLLKMDLLGIRNITIVDDCLNRIKVNTGNKINFDDIPFDDAKAIQTIANGNTMGLFQLESTGMRNSIKQIKPQSFEDIVALLALFRPGPMANIPLYAKRKNGLEKPSYVSPLVQEILEPTYGIIVYQEQVMQIANKMGGLSLGNSYILIKAISKKDSTKMDALKEDFIKGAIKNGYSEKIANETFNYIYQFADYGFNRSHSLCYAIMSCKMAYLKTYYPNEFFAAVLDNNHGSESDQFTNIIGEIRKAKIQLHCPDINISTLSYKFVDNKLYFPLTSIKNVMSQSIISILKDRKENGNYKDIFDFVVRTSKFKIANQTISRLIDAGCFDSLNVNRPTLKATLTKAIAYSDMITDADGQSVIDSSFIPKPKYTEKADDILLNLNAEYEALGLMISGSPLLLYKDSLQKKNITSISQINEKRNNIELAVIVKLIKTIRTKKGTTMAFLTVYDDSGEMELTIFSDLYSKKMLLLKKNKVLIISGFINSRKEFAVTDINEAGKNG